MCDFSKGITFCKCDNEKIAFRDQDSFIYNNGNLVKQPNKRNEKIPLIYIWKLYRHAGKYDQLEMGRYLMPSDDLGNGLNEEWIALNLNLCNCFDFTYNPMNGDNLFIMQNIKFGPYISFIFENGEWKTGHYSPFEDHLDQINSGKLKEI